MAKVEAIMTEELIESLTLKEMRQLQLVVELAMHRRVRKLWVEANGPKEITVGEFCRFRDEQEALGR